MKTMKIIIIIKSCVCKTPCQRQVSWSHKVKVTRSPALMSPVRVWPKECAYQMWAAYLALIKCYKEGKFVDWCTDRPAVTQRDRQTKSRTNERLNWEIRPADVARTRRHHKRTDLHQTLAVKEAFFLHAIPEFFSSEYCFTMASF